MVIFDFINRRSYKISGSVKPLDLIPWYRIQSNYSATLIFAPFLQLLNYYFWHYS